VNGAGRLWVAHAGGRYPVDVAPGGLAGLPALLDDVAPRRRVAVITDRNVARSVPMPLKAPTLVVPPGERAKTRTRWRTLTDRLLDLGFGRDSVVVAVGGGVVGDLAGFVAATFLRGVPCVQVPTSLLAMVDASVGGKTGVNTRHGKNLVGAFHPPAAVLIDPAVLTTLRTAHLRNGLVEAVKHGLVADAAYLDWIAAHAAGLTAREPAALTALVRRSVEIKAEVVGADEREAGRRAVLNAGHTVGHGIERVTGYRVAHGEAVAAGLVAEAALAARLGLAPGGLAADLRDRLRALGAGPVLPAAATDDAMLAAMRHDKKAEGGALRFALPRAPGRLAAGPPWTVPASDDDVRQALGTARALLAG
jgi:3-dehydroquinate synthase